MIGGVKGRISVLGSFLAVVLVVAGTAVAQTTDEEEPGHGEQKHTTAVADETGLSEAEVEALRAEGAGWGVIRHGAALAAAAGMSIEEAIAQIEADEVEGKPPWAGPKRGKGPAHVAEAKALGIPPGHWKQANRIAGATGLDADDLLALKSEEVGWGQIRKAAELSVSDGLSLTDALEQVQATPDD